MKNLSVLAKINRELDDPDAWQCTLNLILKNAGPCTLMCSDTTYSCNVCHLPKQNWNLMCRVPSFLMHYWEQMTIFVLI